MTKSEIFKAAHKMARGTAKCVGNYSVALKLALDAIHHELKHGRGQPAPRDRANRFARRTYLPVSFDEHKIAKYIKENSRILRVFATLSEYNAMREAGRVGDCGGLVDGWECRWVSGLRIL